MKRKSTRTKAKKSVKAKTTRAKRAAPARAAATRAAFSVVKLRRIVSKRGASAETKLEQIRELIA